MPGPDSASVNRGTHDYIETIRARFSDCDSMGVAHHSNYFRWLEEARLGFLPDGGWAYSRIEELGIHMPVVECSCRFFLAARSEELIDVHLQLQGVNRAFLRFTYDLVLAGSAITVASAATKHAYVNEDGRSTRLESGAQLWLWLSDRASR